jgi:hypothetical protein
MGTAPAVKTHSKLAQALEAARSALGSAGSAAAWNEGRAMPIDEVVARVRRS